MGSMSLIFGALANGQKLAHFARLFDRVHRRRYRARKSLRVVVLIRLNEMASRIFCDRQQSFVGDCHICAFYSPLLGNADHGQLAA